MGVEHDASRRSHPGAATKLKEHALPVRVASLFRHLEHMNQDTIGQLNAFLEDIGFPTSKENLLLESLDAPLSQGVRDAIALLPGREYMTREDVRRELIGLPEDDAKGGHHDADDGEDIAPEEKEGNLPGDAPLPEHEETEE